MLNAGPHATDCVEVSVGQGEQQGVSIHLPSFQIGHIPTRVYETPPSSRTAFVSPGDQTSCLSG